MADTIREVMTEDPKTVDASATVEDAAKLMASEDIGNVLVVENDEIKGILTDRDIVVRAIAKGNGGDASVREVATTDVKVLSPDDSIEDALKQMEASDVRRLPVVEDG